MKKDKMVKSIKDIKLEDMHNLFDSVIFMRGEEYFEEGLVMSIEPINSTTITGIVSGNRNYNVSISIDSEGDIVCNCSCPCDFSNCKHAAALLLKWLSVRDRHATELKDGKFLPPKESLEQILSKKSKDELAEILKTAIGRHPELKSLVKLERKELVSKIRALFSNFWDWDEVGALISSLENLLDGIRRNKQMWSKELLDEMETCSGIMLKNAGSVHDDGGELGTFLEDWFLAYGEMFSKTNPTFEEKKKFVLKIFDWMDKDELDGSYFEKALLGMCSSPDDINLIKEFFKSKDPDDEDYYRQFYMTLYDKIGMHDKYMEIARRSGFVPELVDKLVSLNRLDEALDACKNARGFSEEVENRRVAILKRLGRSEELKKALLCLLKKTGDYSYVLKLKQESSTNRSEWGRYLRQIVSDAKNRPGLVSRVYFGEGDFRSAYDYSKTISDLDYLELLAGKLGSRHPELACNLFKKLCFRWIETGSGWPYKKAGRMLEAVKKLDKTGGFFSRTKAEIVGKHKKKYSLMHIIGKV